MVGAVEIERRILQRLAGTLSAEDFATWADAAVSAAAEEGPAIFDSGEAMRLDVLKRAAVAARPGFELTDDELRTSLRRLAFSDEARAHRDSSPAGPLLSAYPARWVPARLFPIVGTCARCGSPVRIREAMLPAAAKTHGALLCPACARRFPGAIVSR